MALLQNMMRRNPFSRVPKRAHIKMTVLTWKKDSFGLFDYDCQPSAFDEYVFHIDEDCSIFRDFESSKTMLQLKNECRPLPQSHVEIGQFCLDRDEKKFEFHCRDLYPFSEKYNVYHCFYRSLRSENPEDMNEGIAALKPGNIVKMGKMEFRIIEMRTSKKTILIEQTGYINQHNVVYDHAKQKEDSSSNEYSYDRSSEEVRCKICFLSEEDENDVLISPCHCKGSVAKVHVGCLRIWINNKIRTESGDKSISYNFNKFECEICKGTFPRIINVKSHSFDMIKLHKPHNTPYIVMESLNNDCEGEKVEDKSLHIMSLKENQSVTLGRGHTCDIRLNDISVSRNHCLIHYSDDTFYLKDTKSKFGTLIKMEEPIVFNKEQSVTKLQIGRSLCVMQFKNMERSSSRKSTAKKNR